MHKDWFEQNNLEYPKTWDELLTDTYKDQISISHPSTAGTGYTIFMSMAEKLGEDGAFEYYTKLKDMSVSLPRAELHQVWKWLWVKLQWVSCLGMMH